MAWRGPVSTLQQRFVKLNSLEGLSVREEMLLRKLYAKKKQDPSIKWESILYHFPGRSLSTIIKSVQDPEEGNLPIELEDEEPSKPYTLHSKVFNITRLPKQTANKVRAKKNSTTIKIPMESNSFEGINTQSNWKIQNNPDRRLEPVIID